MICAQAPRRNGASLLRLSWGVIGVIGVITLSEPAEACTCDAFGEISWSIPSDGATDVPTNVAPWLAAWVATWPAAVAQTEWVVLTNDSGEVVPAERRTTVPIPLICSTQVEWIPSAPLEPHRTYTLVVRNGPDRGSAVLDSISFTTGSGPLDQPPPEIPEIVTKVFDAAPGNSCVDDRYQGCLSALQEVTLEVTTLTHGQPRNPFIAQQYSNVLFGDDVQGNCAEVRARDVVGRRSEPYTFCPAESAFEPIDRVATPFYGEALWNCALNADGEFSVVTAPASEPPPLVPVEPAPPVAADPTPPIPSEPASGEGCVVSRMNSSASGKSAFLGLVASLLLVRRRSRRK